MKFATCLAIASAVSAVKISSELNALGANDACTSDPWSQYTSLRKDMETVGDYILTA